MYAVAISFTEQQLMDIVGSARSGYWLKPLYCELTGDDRLRILTGVIDGQTVINRIIGPRQIHAALTQLQYLKGGRHILMWIYSECEGDRRVSDGEICDSVLQVAVFGEVVFQ